MQVERRVSQPRTRRTGASLNRVLDGTAVAVSAGLQEMFACDMLARLSDDSRGTVEIVLAEVMNNVVEHAYASFPGSIEVWITPRDGYLFIRVVDSGLPMPNGEPPGGALPSATRIEDIPEGGFGWYLIRSLTQELIYARDGGQNLLSFCVGVDYRV